MNYKEKIMEKVLSNKLLLILLFGLVLVSLCLGKDISIFGFDILTTSDSKDIEKQYEAQLQDCETALEIQRARSDAYLAAWKYGTK